ncbi:hypothetical protein EXIGLDRAFT_153132 [Exidia glandulosa HHB12029]|uniref:Uncharacterized protein n=1 Tax=Exidia glandulosa HHB12029 TaxID=1314781 RepID=A0A165QG28_EXIGL|nr:hypothetical protein EXIGLDRAFT_153132 [Exidia glandulosa HHB12029]
MSESIPPLRSQDVTTTCASSALGQPPLQRAERCFPLPALGHSPQLDILLSKYEGPDEHEHLPPHVLPLRVHELPLVSLLDDTQAALY